MLANDQRDRVLNEVAVMAESNNLRFQSDETSALFDTFDSSDRPELHELLSLLTHDDAAPCGEGWEGTKPPGCKRSSGSSKTAKKVPIQRGEESQNQVVPKKADPKVQPKKESTSNIKIVSVFTDKPDLLPGEAIGDRRKRWEANKEKALSDLVEKGKKQEIDSTTPDTPDGWKNIKASDEDHTHFAGALAASNPLRKEWMSTRFGEFKKLAESNPPLLAQDVMAIKVYSTNDFPAMNSALRGLEGDSYKKTLNPNMAEGRDPDRIRNEALQGSKVVTAALNKLPNYEGKVMRGSNIPPGMTLKDIEDIYKPGKRVVEKAFTSTSSENLEAFSSKQIQFVITSKTGKKIKEFSDTKQEEEVLFRPSTPFKVKKTENLEGKLVVYMEED